jgi:glyoxylase-like metal-dependent hydrolase (beta-lactamase superfamily II)
MCLLHVEADECGSLNQWLAVAHWLNRYAGQLPRFDQGLADRPPLPLRDGEVLKLGKHSVRWFDAPHIPHAWESGYLMEEQTRTLLCGDLFTQPGANPPPLTESDILESSEAFRRSLDYYSHSKNGPQILERLAEANPTTLACMHGSAFRGDGAALLRALAASLSQ